MTSPLVSLFKIVVMIESSNIWPSILYAGPSICGQGLSENIKWKILEMNNLKAA
jgi:hypothetical protein